MLKFWLGGVNLAVATSVLTSRGVEPSLSVRLTSLGFPKMRASLRAALVIISFRSTVWHAHKVSRIPCTYYVTCWKLEGLRLG